MGDTGRLSFIEALELAWGARRKFLYEDLVSSSLQIYIEGPAAAVAMMLNLTCYCSIAAVACLWYTGFLPCQSKRDALRPSCHAQFV